MARNAAAPATLPRRIGRISVQFLAALAALCALYVAAGLAGGAIPANRDYTPATRGVRIYVEDNGIHTDIVVPVQAAGIDWRDLVRAEDIADPAYALYDHLAIGWGDRDFYVGTPTWADLDPVTLGRAVVGSNDTVLHIYHIPEPRVGDNVRSIVLSVREYRRLSRFIRASFAVSADGRAPSIHGYGPSDAFYSAHGHYDAFTTCNAWTGRALRHAGVRMGIWTPFPVTVMAWL